MKIFAVYAKPQEQGFLEKLIFVKEGFSWSGLALHLFWLFYLKLWREASVSLLIYIAIIVCDHLNVVTGAEALVLECGMIVFIAASVQDWYARSLEKKGYVLVNVVSGKNQDEAERRFFDAYFAGGGSESAAVYT